MVLFELSWSQGLRIMFIAKQLNISFDTALKRYGKNVKDEAGVNMILQNVYESFIGSNTIGHKIKG